MVQRGTGIITVDGKAKSFGSPATMPTMAQPIENPEETRMKKFYTEQYNIEAQNFARQKMSQPDFDKGMGNLQAKYKLAYNNAKMQANRPDPAYKQYRDLDLYRDKLLKRRAETYSMRDAPGWFTGSTLAVRRDPYSDPEKKGSWDIKLTPQEKQLALDLDNEISSVETMLHASMTLSKNSSLMNTALTSEKSKGGSVADQTKELLNRREGNTQQEDLSQMSDDDLRRIAGGM